MSEAGPRVVRLGSDFFGLHRRRPRIFNSLQRERPLLIRVATPQSEMPPVRVSLTAFSVVAALVYAATTVAAQTPRLERARYRDRDLPPLKYADEAPLCDLDGRRVGRQGLSGTGTGMSYGEPLSFLQDPVLPQGSWTVG